MLPVWTAWIAVPVALIGLVGPFAVKADSVRSLRKAGSPWSLASRSARGYSPSPWRPGDRRALPHREVSIPIRRFLAVVSGSAGAYPQLGSRHIQSFGS